MTSSMLRGGEPGQDGRKVLLASCATPQEVEPVITGWLKGQTRTGCGAAWAQLRNRPALRQAATVPLILAFYCIAGL